MKKAIHLALLALLVPVLSWANIVTYDYEPVYTIYDGSSYAPGDYLFSEDLADVYIAEFFIAGAPYFNGARIEPATALFGSGHILNLNNISVVIDFSAAGDATFEYLYYGGSVNLEINGATPLEGPNMAALVGVVAPGVTLNVVETAFSGGAYGTATLTGPVQRLRVGGQEFYVDDMYCRNGIGAPAGDCDYLVNHETLLLGDTWGSGTHSPGDWIFNEDGIDVTIHELDWGTGGLGFNYCRVEIPAVAGFGSNQTMQLNNVTNFYHIDGLGISVASVKFEYLDWGGTENLQVNGATLHIGDLHTFPNNIAPGVVMTVTPDGPNNYDVELVGNVQQLLIGGQEFFVDEICVIEGEPVPDECDYLVDHESLSVGDTWGSATNLPGEWIFAEDGIDVTIHELTYSSGGLGFNSCRVEAPPVADFGSANTMNLNNVSNMYHIESLGIPVEAVKFEYLDWGGTENLQVNGATLFIGDLDGFPAAVAPGVTMTQSIYSVGGGIRAEVTLYGHVKELLVGGQEFYIDEICVIEGEPLECDYVVDHESLGLGDSWGAGLGHGPGDLAFVEDGIPVLLDAFDSGLNMYFNQCDVVPATMGMGDSQVMQMNNICNLYEISALGKWVAEVTFEFLSYGGIENLEVNGAGRFVGDIELAPAAPAPGVAFTVTTTAVPGGVRGTARLVGEVHQLLLGGQEFLVDNICVKLHASSGADMPMQRGGLELKGNYPNPFNPQTTIRFSLERQEHVRVTIHDAAGRLVKTLLSERMPAGEHPVVWTGRDDRDASVAAGVYLVRVATDSGEVKTHKVGLIK